jgi:hypothetical protein
MPDKVVRIGGASAYYGDSPTALTPLIRSGNLDYLVFDYLAEVTMSFLARTMRRDPTQGFLPDFIDPHMTTALREISERKIKVVANAGGLNPRGCADALRKLCAELGVNPKIAVVEGDNLGDRADEFRGKGYKEMFSGVAFPDKITSINAYLGALPIARALEKGADIVITGRVVDSALTLGPLIHEFGWSLEDYDLMAAGTLAGHINECGAQATGGMHTDWRDVPDWGSIGYPILECRADGSFVVTKPAGTGGMVTVGTVSEQMLYEVSDPQAYMVPDVTCDFSGVKIERIGENRVKVSGAKGYAPPSSYKVCATYQDGWRAVAILPVVGFEAAAKAERQATALLERTRRMLRDQNQPEWTQSHVELLGAESTFGAHARHRDTREVVSKIVVDHPERKATEMFAREHFSHIVSMSPGATGFFGFKPSVAPVVRLFSFPLEKDQVKITMTIDGQTEEIGVPMGGKSFSPDMVTRPAPVEPPSDADADTTVPLICLAWGRSGDKGDLFNVAVIARETEYLPYIAAALTSEAVAEWFAHVFSGDGERRVERFLAPGANAMNFVVHESLGGGGAGSMRLDPLAKGMAQQLLEFPIPVPKHIAHRLADKVQRLGVATPYAGAA